MKLCITGILILALAVIIIVASNIKAKKQLAVDPYVPSAWYPKYYQFQEPKPEYGKAYNSGFKFKESIQTMQRVSLKEFQDIVNAIESKIDLVLVSRRETVIEWYENLHKDQDFRHAIVVKYFYNNFFAINELPPLPPNSHFTEWYYTVEDNIVIYKLKEDASRNLITIFTILMTFIFTMFICVKLKDAPFDVEEKNTRKKS